MKILPCNFLYGIFQCIYLIIIYTLRNFLLEKDLNCHQQKFQIEEKRIVLNIEEIKFEFIIWCRIIFAINLCIAGKSDENKIPEVPYDIHA